MTDLHALSALDQAAAIRAGDVSPVELVSHYLSRIDQLNDSLGAFVTVTAGPALTARSLAESLQRSGVVRGMALDLNPEWVTTANMNASVGPVEDGAWNRDVIALERGQHRNIADDGAKRRVRRPEIQTANRHNRSEKERSSTHFAAFDLALYFCIVTYPPNTEPEGIFESKQRDLPNFSILPCRLDESRGIGP